MSSETRAHDTGGVSREAKMEISAGEGGAISKTPRGLSFEEWEKTDLDDRICKCFECVEVCP